MRIFSVTPINVGAEELARRQHRYNELLPDGFTLDLTDIGDAGPSALDTAEDIAASEAAVIAALRAAPDGYDLLLPDCVLDPGVADLMGELPVVGILQLSLGWQIVRGRRVGMVARNQAIADELMARSAAYGWSDRVDRVEVLGLGVEAISDHDLWTDSLGSAITRFDPTVRTVINGCSAVEVDDFDAVSVVDPTGLALRLLAAEDGQ